jgi:hypothetical protein
MIQAGSRQRQQQDSVAGERRLEIAGVTAADFIALRVRVPLAGAWIEPTDAPATLWKVQTTGSGRFDADCGFNPFPLSAP